MLEPPELTAPAQADTSTEAPPPERTPLPTIETPAVSADVAPPAHAPGTLPPLPRRTATTPPEPKEITEIAEIKEPVMAEDPPASPAVSQTTPSGLPVRVPQASITPALRTEGGPAAAEDVDDAPTPEQIRRSFGGLQSGTRRGRSDAAAKARSHPADPPSASVEDAREDAQEDNQ